ncbi:glucose 1-dehydrogenase [candidate division WOR-3 bacterium]|nr:glucose 1-dehydrogenase [candidate division WOR-3 bacterium]
MKRLLDKVVLVTGGAKGIGRATCRKMAEEGARVAVADLDEEAVRQVVDEIGKDKAKFWKMDVADPEDVKRVFGEVKEEFGRLDVLVNNAGIAGPDKPTHKLTVDDWDRVLNVNVKGVFLGTKHAVPLMRENGGGSIVNLSSIYGIVGGQDNPPYHASKGAVRLMTKTDALLYAEDGIRVNSVHPGFIWTPMVQGLAEGMDKDKEEFRKELAELHPVGRVGEPDDVAWAIVYLASDESRFVTGSELVVDGGYTSR